MSWGSTWRKIQVNCHSSTGDAGCCCSGVQTHRNGIETEEPENFRGGDPVPVIAASAHRFDFLALETTTLTPTLQIRDSKVMESLGPL
ncbi:hypothetical protein DY000_02032077 [Brassica cretica]|uniref:Uncharacterized protein n=1 Tax=Brassica cretica TaxID=69181 RepID=A0ABQ7DPN6_BRACR|nr:hypothetical protein DY000_02032077 [Brassica cretica]